MKSTHVIVALSLGPSIIVGCGGQDLSPIDAFAEPSATQLGPQPPKPEDPPTEKPMVANPDSNGSDAYRDVMAAQIPLVEISDQLHGSDGASGGLGGIRIDVSARAVDVWWKGPIGDGQRAIAEDAKRKGIEVNFMSAKYSQGELLAAMDRYHARAPVAHKDLVYLAPRVDGSGIHVGQSSDFDARILELGVDAFAVTSSPMEPKSRGADTPPWWGGSSIMPYPLTAGGVCTSGFAVGWGWSIDRNAGVGLVTADHCAPGGGVPFFSTGSGRYIGTAFRHPTNESIEADSLLIETASAPAARIYDGPAGTSFSKPVAGAAFVVPGMSVCQSGAFSGTVCGLTVDSIKNQFYSPSFTQSIAFAKPAPSNPPSIVVRPGDSGGPVYTLASDPSKVLAAGMTVGSKFTDCGPSGCLQNLAFIDLDFLIFHHVTLMTQ